MLQSIKNNDTLLKAMEVWTLIDPALLDDAGQEDVLADDQDARVLKDIKSVVLKRIDGNNPSRSKPIIQGIAKYAWLAAAVVILAGVSWLFADLLPAIGTHPTTPASTFLPTQQTTKINPTGATQATQTTPMTTQATQASIATTHSTLLPGMVVHSDQFPPDPIDYKLPQQGHVLTTSGVQKAIAEPINDPGYFFVHILILPVELYSNPLNDYVYNSRHIGEWEDLVDLSEPAVATEIARLFQLGYDVFWHETWSYTGQLKEKRYANILAGLLTKDQLLRFPASSSCGYIIDWVYNGDGTVNWRVDG